jgi:multicomponent K+:H+ antiporter subunit F
MLSIVTSIAMVMVGFAIILNLFRLVQGPDAIDRILAIDTLNINTIALVILIGIYSNTLVYFEAALLIAMVGFVGTVALCKFMVTGNIIE